MATYGESLLQMFNFACRYSDMCRLLVALVGYWILMSTNPSAAQLQSGFTQGLWVIGSTETCSLTTYQWSLDGAELRFVDSSGAIDVEKVVAWKIAGFFSTTIRSSSVPPGTRWEYSVIGPDTVQVRNLINGRNFVLNRCPVAAMTPQMGSTVAVAGLIHSRIGPGFDCGKARDALSGLICASDRLAWLDLRFTQAYQALRLQAGELGQSAVRTEAIEFQAQVYVECSLPKVGFVPASFGPAAEACVSRAYQNQRNAWVARLSSIVQDEVSRPLEAHLLLQAALQRQGYLPPTDLVDGVYGPSTRAGIIAWQQAHNRQPTGTLSAADAHLLAPTVPETGSGGPDLRIVTPDPLYGVPEQSQSPADPRELKAEQERRETISRLDAEKARADADKAQADADRARAEAVIVVAKERAKAEAARKAAEQERSEIEAHGIQP